MSPGYYISGVGHAALIAFLLAGGLLSRERLPEVRVTEVSILTEEEFAALTRPEEGPPVVTDAPVVLAPETEAAPDAPEPQDTAPAPRAPAPPDPAEPPAAPDAPEAPPGPAPQAEVQDAAPVIAAPSFDTAAAPPAPERSLRPAPRVAPRPATPPPPQADTAPEPQEAAQPLPEPEPEAPPEESREAAAPQEATTEIVTEAKESPLAPASSPRPRSRPARPERVAEEPTPPAPADTDSAVLAALGETPPQAATEIPTGPPLTAGEKDALRLAVQQCWNVGSLSTEALRTVVTVAVTMTREGKPDTASIRLIEASGGSDAAARQAFEAARRAIIRCGSRGFNLPVEKYAQWREIEMTFNPEKMRIR